MKIIYSLLFILLIPGIHQAQVWEPHFYLTDLEQHVISTHVVDDSVVWLTAKYIFASDYYYEPLSTYNYAARTTDGGQTWTNAIIPFSNNFSPGNITAVSRDTAWVIGANFFWSSPGGGQVFRTTDGGVNWVQQTSAAFLPNVSYANWIHFFDRQRGVCMGDPRSGEFEIYRTANGGQNWTLVPAANIPNPQPDEIGWQGVFDARGDTIWFSTSKGRLFRSTDAGLQWAVHDLGVPDNLAPYLSFNAGGRGMVGVYDNAQTQATLRRTTDDGLSWEDVTAPNNGNFRINDLTYVPGSNTLLLTGRVLNIAGPFYSWVSHDHGETWQQIDNTSSVVALHFRSPTLGWGGTSQLGFTLSGSRMYRYAGSPLVGIFSGTPLEADITVAPNPTTDFASVRVSTAAPAGFLLLLNDAQGRLIQRFEIETTADFQQDIDLSQVPAGIYTLTISSARGYLTRKIVKI